MQALLKRMALNGLLTAVMLAAMGFVFAELASIFLAGNSVPRAEPIERTDRAPENDSVSRSLRQRVPFTMAVFGFLFVTIGELILYAWRGHPPIVVEKTDAERRADPAEKLLEELLAQADAALAASATTSESPTTADARHDPHPASEPNISSS